MTTRMAFLHSDWLDYIFIIVPTELYNCVIAANEYHRGDLK